MHKDLLDKPKEVFLDCYVQLIASFQRERFFQLRVEHVRSLKDILLTAGVPQGNVLVPLLFSVFVIDVPRVGLSLFTDDTAIFSTDVNASFAAYRIQRELVAYIFGQLESR